MKNGKKPRIQTNLLFLAGRSSAVGLLEERVATLVAPLAFGPVRAPDCRVIPVQDVLLKPGLDRRPLLAFDHLKVGTGLTNCTEAGESKASKAKPLDLMRLSQSLVNKNRSA